MNWLITGLQILFGRFATHPLWYMGAFLSIVLVGVLTRRVWITLLYTILVVLLDELHVFGPSYLKVEDLFGCYCVNGYWYPTHELVIIVLFTITAIYTARKTITEHQYQTITILGALFLLGGIVLGRIKTDLTLLSIMGTAIITVGMIKPQLNKERELKQPNR